MPTLEVSNDRPFPLPKEAMDTLNSVSWFLMDAFWMLQVQWISQALIAPTILSGLILLYMERRKSLLFVNAAVCFWILMNVLWMLGDTHQASQMLLFARICFASGVGCILLAVRYSSDLRETFSHFKRFRLMSPYRPIARPQTQTTRAKRPRKAQSTPYKRAIQ